MEFVHIPVLLNEVIESLQIKPNGIYVDCTVGGAGHSSEIVKKLSKNGILIAFDKDIDAINAASLRLKEFCQVVVLTLDELSNFDFSKYDNRSMPLAVIIKSDFKNFKFALEQLNIDGVYGVLIDLGISSHQIDCAERGFSFRQEAKLDMRMDQSATLTAADIVNNYTEQQLADIFFRYGEEEFARPIAKNIVKFRVNNPIETTLQLNDIVENSMPKKVVFSRGGAAKKVFQALRIVVNGELDGLDALVENVVEKLNINARFSVISFHSLEDRIVKQTFKELARECICPPNIPICVCGHKAKVKLITKKPIIASEEELKINSRSASAKLRVVEKV